MTIVAKLMMMRSMNVFHRCDQTTMTMSSYNARVIVVWSCRSKRMMTSMVPSLVLIVGVG
jgi:hypothetical protein